MSETTVEIAGLQLIDYLELEEQLPAGTVRQAPAPAGDTGAHGSPDLVVAVITLTAAVVQALTMWLSRRHAESEPKIADDGITLTVSPDHTITIMLGHAAEPPAGSGAKLLSGIDAVTEAVRAAAEKTL